MKRLFPFLVGLLVSLGPVIPSAWAEPFAIRDGSLGGGVLFWFSVPAGALGGVGVTSEEFRVSGGTLNPEIVQPGQPFTVTEILSGTFAGEAGGVSTVHDVDGFGTADLHVTSGRLLAPAPFPGPGGLIFLTTTFSMSGVLAGSLFEVFNDGAVHLPIASFRNDVFGHGSGTIILQPLFETGNYEVLPLFGTFEPGAPVPEPGTIVLLGLSGITLAARGSRRHKATR
jgi:hypothetical protein